MKTSEVEESLRFLALEKTVGNMALQLTNLDHENGIIRKENEALRVTVEELEVEVIDLQARLEYVEAVTRKDGERVNILYLFI